MILSAEFSVTTVMKNIVMTAFTVCDCDDCDYDEQDNCYYDNCDGCVTVTTVIMIIVTAAMTVTKVSKDCDAYGCF
jgi:hypothetical protein